MLNAGLLGAGQIGNVHARAISAHTGSRLVAVSDVAAKAAANLAQAFGAQRGSTDDILGDKSIGAVLIATSTSTHSDLIERATGAGKAVLCEKSVDLSFQRAIACKKAVTKTGCAVMIGFNRRFDQNFSALKVAADKGEIGKAELLSVTSFAPATAVVTLAYEDGRIAVIKSSRRAVYGYDQRLELLGSEGLRSPGNVLERTVVKSTTSGVVGAKPELFFLEPYMRAYAAEWGAFVNSLSAGATPAVTLDDGFNALALAEAASQSAQAGRPIALASVLG